MRSRSLKTWLIIVNLILFGLNFTPAMAQVMEIEVVGAGYRLKGPDIIQFPTINASASAQQSTRDIRDLDPQDEESPSSTLAKDYLYIGDMNGGNGFNVAVSATDLEDYFTHDTIPSSNLLIKNKNGTGSDIVANSPAQPSLEGVILNPDTDNFTGLNSQKTLFTGAGRQPGAWRIFPVFRINVPAYTHSGTYISTLTFTII